MTIITQVSLDYTSGTIINAAICNKPKKKERKESKISQSKLCH